MIYNVLGRKKTLNLRICVTDRLGMFLDTEQRVRKEVSYRDASHLRTSKFHALLADRRLIRRQTDLEGVVQGIM